MTATTKTNERTIIMNRNTDLEKIRELAKKYLNMEIKPCGQYVTDVSHPFFEGRFYNCSRSTAEKGYLDIVDNPEDCATAKALRVKYLDEATSPVEIFELLTRGWDFRFLDATKDMMSTDDLSKVLRRVWKHSGYASNTQMPLRQDVVQMFRECNPHILMNDAEREMYQALPNEVTVYCGAIRNKRQLVKAFSWTMDPEMVKWPGPLRFESSTGKAYTAKVKKQDVLACFEPNSEVVVNPDKLYDIEKYSI